MSKMPELLCRSCGRQITNDLNAPNAAMWTLYEPRWPYCADSPECARDVLDEWRQSRWQSR